MEDSNTKSIRFSEAINERMEGLANKLGLSKRALLIQMVEYFYRTKKDPADINDELLRNSLAKSHKTYMSFIKSQEDLLLIPMKQSMDKMIANQRDIVKYFNEQVLGANKNLINQQNVLSQGFKETEKLIKIIYSSLEQKEWLKTNFMQILSTYVKSREELGSFKGREKEELYDLTKKQIENL